MKDFNEIFKGLLGQAAKKWIESDSDTPKGKDALNFFFWLKLGVFLFLGAEILKVIFRSNFGKEAISLFRITLASLLLIGWSLLSLVFVFTDLGASAIYYQGIFGGRVGFLLTTLVYIILAFYVFTVGGKERLFSESPENQQSPFYRGDSVLLRFLTSEGWSQKKIQEVAEPLLTFSISIFLIALNPMLGFPILFCSISLILGNFYENLFGMGDSKVKQVLGKQTNEESGFSAVS